MLGVVHLACRGQPRGLHVILTRVFGVDGWGGWGNWGFLLGMPVFGRGFEPAPFFHLLSPVRPF